MTPNIKSIIAFISVALVLAVYVYTPRQLDSDTMISGSNLINPIVQFDDNEYQLFPIGERIFNNPVGATCFSNSDQSFLVAEQNGLIYKVWTAADGFVKTKKIHNINSAQATGSPIQEILDLQCRSESPNAQARDILVTVREFGANRPPILIYIAALSADNERLSAFSKKKPAIILKNIAADQLNQNILLGPEGRVILSFQTAYDGYLTSQDSENFRGKVVMVTPNADAAENEICAIAFTSSFGATKHNNCGPIQIAASGISNTVAMQLSPDSRKLKVLDKQFYFGWEVNEILLDTSVNLGWPYIAGDSRFRKTSIDLEKLTAPTYYSTETEWISSAKFHPRDDYSEIFYLLSGPEGPALYIDNIKTKQSAKLDLADLGREPFKINILGELIVLTREDSSLAVLQPKDKESRFTNVAIESKYLFSQYCENCHGTTGKSSFLGIRPLSGGSWAEGQMLTKSFTTISEGIDHKMPRFSATLTKRQIEGLAIYIHGMSR